MSLLAWLGYGVLLLTIFFVADWWRRKKNYALFTEHFYNFILSFLLCLTGFDGIFFLLFDIVYQLFVCGSFFVFFISVFQCLRVYQLDKHDIKGSQYKQALEWFEVMHSFSIYIISYHISGTVEKFQQVAAESIIDIEKSA